MATVLVDDGKEIKLRSFDGEVLDCAGVEGDVEKLGEIVVGLEEGVDVAEAKLGGDEEVELHWEVGERDGIHQV